MAMKRLRVVLWLGVVFGFCVTPQFSAHAVDYTAIPSEAKEGVGKAVGDLPDEENLRQETDAQIREGLGGGDVESMTNSIRNEVDTALANGAPPAHTQEKDKVEECKPEDMATLDSFDKELKDYLKTVKHIYETASGSPKPDTYKDLKDDIEDAKDFGKVKDFAKNMWLYKRCGVPYPQGYLPVPEWVMNMGVSGSDAFPDTASNNPIDIMQGFNPGGGEADDANKLQ